MNGEQLKEVLDSVRGQKDLVPHDGITFCNVALDRILGLCGIPRIINPLAGQPHMANSMIDYMRASTKWQAVNGDVACARASQGVLVVACQQEDGHGHVSPVYPVPMQFSGSWGKDVPMLSNVGKRNGVLRASQCFHDEPLYFSQKI